MPYNVICLACTVVAFAFGPMVNYTTKSLKIVEADDEKASGLKEKLKKMMAKAMQMALAKFTKSPDQTVAEPPGVATGVEDKKGN